MSDTDRETLYYWQSILWANQEYLFEDLIDLTGFSISHLRKTLGVAKKHGIISSEPDPEYPRRNLYRLKSVVVINS